MSTQVGTAIKAHHRELIETLEAQVAALVEGKSGADPQKLADFLKNELLPHAVGEEQHMYPALDSLLTAYGKPTATMSVDHEFIENYIRQIDEAAQALSVAQPSDRGYLQTRLNRLALQLEALMHVHLEKEERVYLPLFEQYLSEAEQQRILEGMHEAYEAEDVTLDVRDIRPPQRHPLIFQTFESLSAGKSFILVNDHDPKPLYYQFRAERDGQFTWDYLEQGPEVWRVRVGKAN